MSRFRYCLNASTIATTPILKQIEVAAAAGYEAIELWHDHIDTHLAAGGTLAEIRRAIDDSGLKIPTTIYLAGWFQPAGPNTKWRSPKCVADWNKRLPSGPNSPSPDHRQESLIATSERGTMPNSWNSGDRTV